jgi:probable rRNA maturation factor
VRGRYEIEALPRLSRPLPCVIIDAMEINVLFDEGFEGTLDEGWLRKVAAKALIAEHQSDAEMGILITGQDKIRQLHKEYMGEDEPTDVLSFAMREKGPVDAPDFVFPAGDAAHLGEVIISYPQAEIQAGEHGHSAKKEVAILLIHGVLHLLGYDHDQPERHKTMQVREKAILKLVSEGLD